MWFLCVRACSSKHVLLSVSYPNHESACNKDSHVFTGSYSPNIISSYLSILLSV